MNDKAICIHVAQFYITLILLFNKIILKFIISSIDKPRDILYTGLLIFTFIFFISIAGKFSEKHFDVW